MHVELRDLVALADQPEELSFGGRERRVRHHVQQSDVELADVLVQGRLAREDGLAFRAQGREGGQLGIGDERHAQAPAGVRSSTAPRSARKSASLATPASSVVVTV
jgi:hypothetical protein